MPINFALLQLVTTSQNDIVVEPEILPSIIQALSKDELESYKIAKKCIEELALYLKPGNAGNNLAGLFSRPMQRKLVTLINCQLMEEEGRSRSMRAARSLGERTVTELILQHQNPQQLSANLWAAVRARGCQFLGPAMQEEVLKLILLALETGESLSRKVLVMYVVQQLEKYFPQASKTSIGHVVQLLYRASCFKVSKRDGDSSLMQLKDEFRNYKALRKEHDAQIVQIATEAGLRIAPDQWSSLLYGDSTHKSDMQSLIDKQQSPQSFGQSVQELMIALQRTSDPANLSALREDLIKLAEIDSSTDSNVIPIWQECAEAMESVKRVVDGLVDFVQHHSNRKQQDSGHAGHPSRYKINYCRDYNNRGQCPRGKNCTFAHTDEEADRYRSKVKRHNIRPLMKDSNQTGPNKVNIAYPFYGGNNMRSGGEEVSPPQRYNKTMPYRSENSLINTPAKNAQHLMPSTYPTSSSSCSTPNLSQTQLSPKMVSTPIAVQTPLMTSGNGSRFQFNNYPGPSPMKMMNVMPNQQMTTPSMSSQPPHQNYMKQPSQDYKKQFPNYHNNNNSPPAVMPKTGNGAGYYHHPQQQPQHHPMPRNEDFSNNNNCSNNNGNQPTWPNKMKKPSNQLMLPSKSQQAGGDSNQTSPINRVCDIDYNRQSLMNYQYPKSQMTSEVENMAIGLSNMWMGNNRREQQQQQQQPPQQLHNTPQHQPHHVTVFQFDSAQAKDNFVRSDSILKSNDDEYSTFENTPVSGRYGPIGNVKSALEMENNPRGHQWSGLQSIPKSFGNNNNYNCGPFNNDSPPANSMKIGNAFINSGSPSGGMRGSFGNGAAAAGSNNGRALKSGTYNDLAVSNDMNVRFECARKFQEP